MWEACLMSPFVAMSLWLEQLLPCREGLTFRFFKPDALYSGMPENFFTQQRNFILWTLLITQHRLFIRKFSHVEDPCVSL